jgi:hypothetical protein
MQSGRQEGLRAYLFKKLQLGGVREIFVLKFLCRLIVYFVEFLSRKLCSLIDGEMQTHSHDKLARINMHFKKIRKSMHKFSLDKIQSCYNSDDNTTWCQRFVMSMFGVVFSKIISGPMLNVVCKIFNMCTLKKLQLPMELLNEFANKPEVRSQVDPGLNELKDQFFGIKTGKQKLIEPYGTMLHNTSNFMQGIFHYTSSLIHAAYMMVIEDFE